MQICHIVWHTHLLQLVFLCLSVFLHDSSVVYEHEGKGYHRQYSHTEILQLDATIDYPTEERRGEIKRTAGESFRYLGCLVASGIKHMLCCHCEVGCHVGNEIQADDESHESDDERLHHIALGERQYHREEVEHSGERCQRQELVAGQEHCQSENHGNEEL